MKWHRIRLQYLCYSSTTVPVLYRTSTVQYKIKLGTVQSCSMRRKLSENFALRTKTYTIPTSKFPSSGSYLYIVQSCS